MGTDSDGPEGNGAELDFALVADSARIENGKLDVLGGSFTRAHLGPGLRVLEFAIVGRVRAPEGSRPVVIDVDVDMPGDVPRLSWSDTLRETNAHSRYDGKVAYLFSLSVRITPPAVSGLAEIFIRLDETPVRRLAFDVTVADQ